MTTTASEAGELVAGMTNSRAKSGMPRSVSRAGYRAERVTIGETELSTSTGGSPQCRHQGCARRAVLTGHCRHHHEIHSRWQAGGFADAGPVRQHVRALLDAGVSLRAIHCVTGADHRALAHLIIGGPATGTWPQGRIPVADAQRILDIPVPVRPADPTSDVPSVGTVRRLRALSALGYSPTALGKRLAMAVGVVRELLEGGHTAVDVRTARRVAALFEELQMQPGPSAAARQSAAERGWAPPLAWDEHSIDNPAAEPSCGPKRKLLFDEIYLELRDMGLRNHQIANRLGITMDSLYRQLLRYGMAERYSMSERTDLA